MAAEDQQTQPGADERSERIRKCIEQYTDRGVRLAQIPVPETGPLAQSYWARLWYENIRTIVRDAGADMSLADSAEDLARHGEVVHLCFSGIGLFSVQGIVAGEECSETCCEAAVFWPQADAKKLKELRRRAGNRLSPEDLLAGNVPKKLAVLLDSPANGLLPTFTEMRFCCTCQEGLAGRPCTHTLALCVVVASLLNTKPELIFTLRGLQHGRFRYDDAADTPEVLMVLHNTGHGWECIGKAHADPAPAIAAMNRHVPDLQVLGQYYEVITADEYRGMVRRMELMYAGTEEDLLTSFAFVAQDGEDMHAVEMRASRLFLELLLGLAEGEKRMEALPQLVQDFLLDAANVPKAPEERAPALEKMLQEKGQEAWDHACDLMCRRIRNLFSGDFGPADIIPYMFWDKLPLHSDADKVWEDEDREDEDEDEAWDWQDREDQEVLKDLKLNLEELRELPGASQHRHFPQQVLAKHVLRILHDVAEEGADVEDIPDMVEEIALDLLDAPKDPGERALFVQTMQAKVGWKQWHHHFEEIAAEVFQMLTLAMSSPDEFASLLDEDDLDDIKNRDSAGDTGHGLRELRQRALMAGFTGHRQQADTGTAEDDDARHHRQPEEQASPAGSERLEQSEAPERPDLSAASESPAGSGSADRAEPPVDSDCPTGEGLKRLLAIWRDVRGKTAADMAAHLKVTPDTLSRWVNSQGRISMRPSSLARVLKLQEELLGQPEEREKASRASAEERSQQRAKNIARCQKQCARLGRHLVQVPVPETGPLAHSYWARLWYENIRTLVRDAGADMRLAEAAEESARHGEVLHLVCTHTSMFSVQGIVAGEECFEPLACWLPVSGQKLARLRRSAGRISPEDLLAGRLPKKLAGLLEDPQSGMLPTAQETIFHCTCADGAEGRLCTHVLALLFATACLLDKKPETLFTMRGLLPGTFSHAEETDLSERLMILHETADGWECLGEPHADPAPAIAALNEVKTIVRPLGLLYTVFTIDRYSRLTGSLADSDDDWEEDAAAKMLRKKKFLFLRLLEDIAAGRKRRKDLPQLVEDLLLDSLDAPQDPGERARFLQELKKKMGQKEWDEEYTGTLTDVRTLLSGKLGPLDEIITACREAILEDEAEEDRQRRSTKPAARADRHGPTVDPACPTGEDLDKLLAIFKVVRKGTAADMAAILEVSPATLSRWVNTEGRITMHPSSLARVLELQDELWGRSPAGKKGTGRR